MINLSLKEIELMDKVFLYYYTNQDKLNDYYSASTYLNIEHKEYYYIYDLITEYGQKEKLLGIDTGNECIINEFVDYRCDKFRANGGFKGYFERLNLNNVTNVPTKAQERGCLFLQIKFGMLHLLIQLCNKQLFIEA